MAYTQSALDEQLRTAEKLPVGLPWRLLIFSIVLFGLLIFLYFGMTLGYKPYLGSQLSNLDKQITNLSQSVDENQQRDLGNFYSQLVNLQGLTTSHVKTSQALTFLEKNVHPNIYYNSSILSVKDRQLKLSGKAPSYGVLAEQLALFQKAPEVENVFLDGSTADKGVLSFDLSLTLKPAVFQ